MFKTCNLASFFWFHGEWYIHCAQTCIGHGRAINCIKFVKFKNNPTARKPTSAHGKTIRSKCARNKTIRKQRRAYYKINPAARKPNLAYGKTIRSGRALHKTIRKQCLALLGDWILEINQKIISAARPPYPHPAWGKSLWTATAVPAD